MSDKSPVRIAGPDDFQEVFRLLLLAHAENSVFPADNQKVVWFVNRFIHGDKLPKEDNAPRGVIAVIGPSGGTLEALAMMGINGNYWYTLETHFEEYVVYVDPNFRRSTHCRELIKWMKAAAEKYNKRLVSGVISTFRTEAKVALYGRMLQEVGRFFMHPPAFHSDQLTGPSRSKDAWAFPGKRREARQMSKSLNGGSNGREPIK